MISLTNLIKRNLNLSNKVSLLFVGDSMNNPPQVEHAKGYNYTGYFSNIKNYVNSKDYAIVNLETPINKQVYTTKIPSQPIFWASENYLKELKFAGFDLFMTANNHALDQGNDGVKNTINKLNQLNLDHIGTYYNEIDRKNKLPFIKEINGIKIGFINYTYKTKDIKPEDKAGYDIIIDYIDENIIKKDIELTKEKGADIIICYIHWGEEHESKPSKEQEILANKILKFGANIIIGSHPHVIQPIIFRNNKLVAYSLGNFISSMKKNHGGLRDTKGGLMLSFDLYRDYDDKVIIDNVSYRLMYTSINKFTDNFEVNWAINCADPKAEKFLKETRSFLNQNNLGATEDILY